MAKLKKSEKDVDVTEDVVVEEQESEVPAEELVDSAEIEGEPEPSDTNPALEVDLTPPTEQYNEYSRSAVVDQSVELNLKDAKVDEDKKPEESVRIRLRQDHSCCIAMEYYDFKEGKVYNVPRNVKRILNKAGLLSPL